MKFYLSSAAGHVKGAYVYLVYTHVEFVLRLHASL